MKRKPLLLVPVAALAILPLSGCMDKATEPFRDAPIDAHNGDSATVVEMPDGFSNLSYKCVPIGSHGVLFGSAFHGDDNRTSVTATYLPDGCP